MKRLLLILLASCGAVYAQQNALLLPWTPQQFTNTNGTVLANGKVCTYQAGTSTGLATYTDSTASVANNVPPNAILLDSTGRPVSGGIWLKSPLAYKITVLTAGSDNTCNTGVVIKTQDQVVTGSGAGLNVNNIFTGSNTFTNLNNCQYVNATQSLVAAIAAVSNPGCIVVATQYVMAASSTIPAGVTLAIQGSGSITTTGFTLTVNGGFTALPTQVLLGTGTLVFGNNSWPIMANWFPGVDIGAQINNAYAALTIPAAACTVQTIDIASKTDGSAYAYTTPILLNRTGLLVKLRGTVTLNYTPVTATTAMTLDYMSAANCPNQHPTAHGIEGIRLINNGDAAPNGGGGTSAVGLQLGNTNGAEGALLSGFTAASFSTGISIPGGGVNAFGMTCIDCVLARNVTGISLGTTTETTTFVGGRIIVNGTGVSYANGDFYLSGMSIDSNTTFAASGTGNFHSSNNHYENFNSANCNYINATNGTVSMNGDAIADDSTMGTCTWFVHLNGASGSFNGVTVVSAGQTVTQAILVDQPSTAYINLINQNASLITVSGGSATVQSIVDTTQGKSGDAVHPSAFGQGIIIGPTANAVSTSSRTVGFQQLDGTGTVRTATLGVGVNTANRAYTLPDIGGVVSVVGCTTSQKTESAADTNVLTCAIPLTAATYRLRFVLSLSAANAATLGWTATWTDSNGNAQTPTNLSLFQSGTAVPALTFTTSAAGNYYGYADIDVNNAGTSPVVKLTFAGTSFTGKATATIEKLL